MSNVRITCPGRDDRVAALKSGEVVIGSGLDCDIVVFGNGVGSKHLTLSVEDSAIHLQSVGQRPTVVHRAKGAPVELAPGDTAQWMPADHITIGDLSIVLEGVNLKPVSKGKRRGIGFNPKSIGTTTIFACLALVILGGFGALIVASVAQPARATMLAVPDPVIDTPQVTADFETAGYDLETITETPTGFHVSTYVGSLQEQSDFVDFSEGLPYPVDHHVFVESRLLSAVNLVLENTDYDTEVIGINRGVVEMRGMIDAQQKENVARTIKDDVPGITDVTFTSFDAEQASGAISDKIVGVWYGDQPYVFMKDGRTVRPGDVLSDQITLMAVASETELLISNQLREWSFHWHD